MGEEIRPRERPDGEGRGNPGIRIWDFIRNDMDESSQEDFKQRSNMINVRFQNNHPGCTVRVGQGVGVERKHPAVMVGDDGGLDQCRNNGDREKQIWDMFYGD